MQVCCALWVCVPLQVVIEVADEIEADKGGARLSAFYNYNCEVSDPLQHARGRRQDGTRFGVGKTKLGI